MAHPYFSQLHDLIAPFVAELGGDVDIECTHFFSGAAVYVNGNICMSFTPVGFALKLPEAERQQIISDGGHPLRYFPSGPIKKGYVVLPQTLTGSDEALAGWLRRCVEAMVDESDDG